MRSEITANEILQTEMEDNPMNAATIGQFLACITRDVFSRDGLYGDKLPFIQNEWEEDIAYALVLNGHLDGEIRNTNLVDYNHSEFTILLNRALDLLHGADYSTLALPPEPKGWYVIRLDIDDHEKPILYDYMIQEQTEKVAKQKAESFNQADNSQNWVALKISPVT